MCENGQCDGAMHFLELALRIRKLKYGEDHETVADTQQWMGNVMRQWSEYGEALELFKTPLRIKTERLGNCGMIFDVTQKLAESYSKENNYDKALELYSQLIDVSDRIKNSGCERLSDMFV